MTSRKTVLVVLFIPSVERDGTTQINQDKWVTSALEMFGQVFGGATAYPVARGVWRDDARGGELVMDKPVVIHCYTTEEDIENSAKIQKLRGFCCNRGRKTKQGEVGLVINNEYFAITDYD